ncbi:RNA pyrophosphohydrolase [Sphingopyxis granuli]|uniref:RNA pyrophosphohydrolase n=1 Tax=Sphingopyxis granuli TaxID=267128 RepID=UPI001F53CBBE|nr:RNA pyrophosphohydrolase [Sphingopyxis granuli]UNK78516.1 RNA pyrophosphohydrolase [Sphingopyxis granuli]
MSDAGALPYRPCAGVMLANRTGRIFVGQRLDSRADAWQMPQGGIDPGEDAEAAALRELEEETGVHAGLVDIIARSRTEHLYDLPDDLIGTVWGGRYRGQRQNWFLMRFMGEDTDVHIVTPHQEFRAWRWAELDELERLIVPFKRALYRAVVEEFRPLV